MTEQEKKDFAKTLLKEIKPILLNEVYKILLSKTILLFIFLLILFVGALIANYNAGVSREKRFEEMKNAYEIQSIYYNNLKAEIMARFDNIQDKE